MLTVYSVLSHAASSVPYYTGLNDASVVAFLNRRVGVEGRWSIARLL